jgi:co-chaperonin GroES (HSP10)
MAKKLVSATGGELKSNTPKIKKVHPFGSTILVEMLTSQEALGTKMSVPDTASVGAPQAYILELGPRVDPTVGVKVGDRVMLQGSYVPVANFDNSHRHKGIVEVHNIKAVIEEEKTSLITVE